MQNIAADTPLTMPTIDHTDKDTIKPCHRAPIGVHLCTAIFSRTHTFFTGLKRNYAPNRFHLTFHRTRCRVVQSNLSPLMRFHDMLVCHSRSAIKQDRLPEYRLCLAGDKRWIGRQTRGGYWKREKYSIAKWKCVENGAAECLARDACSDAFVLGHK